MKKPRKDLSVMVTDRCLKVIEDLRKEWSLTEIAEKIGSNYRHIGYMRNGDRFATTEMLVGLCLYYRVNARYLLPPFEKNMYLGKTNEKLIREKKIQLEQTKKEIKILEGGS